MSIESDIRELSSTPDREVGGPGHAAAKRYLLRRLQAIGVAPFKNGSLELPYRHPHPTSGITTNFMNIAGVIPGTEVGRPPILVGAHYDTVPGTPGADDNAAAVAVVLAVAEECAHQSLKQDIIVALFDAEEPPFYHNPSMGSTRFYNDHCSEIAFKRVIIMDLVGHDVETGDPGMDALFPRLKDLLFVMGAESERSLPGVVERAARTVAGLRVVPTLNSYVPDMSDHYAFRLGGQPYLFLSCGYGRHSHGPDDNMDWINMDKVLSVYQFATELIREAGCGDDDGPECDLDQGGTLDRPRGPFDPVDFEIRMIEEAMGTELPALLTGRPRLRSRADLNKLASRLRGFLGV